MRNIIPFLFTTFLIIIASCKNERKLSEREKNQIVEDIINEYYSDKEQVKTINSLMPICELEYWVSLSNERLAFNKKHGMNKPPSISYDTIVVLSNEILKILSLSPNDEFTKVIKCTKLLDLNDPTFNLISWDDLYSVRSGGLSYQVFSTPIFNKERSKLILYHKKFTREIEFTVNLFAKQDEGWKFLKSTSRIGI